MELIFFGISSAVQTAEHTNVSFVVIEKASTILVEASGNPIHNLLKANIDILNLDVVILSHAHPDHLYALPSLIQNFAILNRRKPLNIICNQPTANKADQLLELFSLSPRKLPFSIKWHTHEKRVYEEVAGIRIVSFPVNHTIPTSGFKLSTEVSSLVYSSDTLPCKSVITHASGATALIHESTGSESNSNKLNADGHSSALQAGDIAQKSGVTKLFLCHFDIALNTSPAKMQHEAGSAFKGKVIVPEPFMTYKI